MRWAFACLEQLIASAHEFESARAAEVPGGGWMLRVQLVASGAAPLLERARLRLSEGQLQGCAELKA